MSSQSHDDDGNIIGDKNGNFADKDAQINFGFAIDNYINMYSQRAKDGINSFYTILGAGNWLKENSKKHQQFDIKDVFGQRKGYLLNGKYVSGETAGNYLFGKNLESLREFSTLTSFVTKRFFFTRAAEEFGHYNNTSNGTNIPEVAPYYGEIPYSGRAITNGYYNNNPNNPVFTEYPQTSLYGNIKIK